MNVTVPCPVCGLALDVPQTTDAYGNPVWDAATAIANHIATAHATTPDLPDPSDLTNPAEATP